MTNASNSTGDSSDGSRPERSNAFSDPLYPDVLSAYGFFETANLDEVANACVWLATLIEFMPAAEDSEYSQLSKYHRKLRYQLRTINEHIPEENRVGVETLGLEFPIALEVADRGFSERRLVTEARERLTHLADVIRRRLPPPQRSNAFKVPLDPEVLPAYALFETANLEQAAHACMWLASLIDYMPSAAHSDRSERLDYHSQLDDQLGYLISLIPAAIREDVDSLGREFPIALETANEEHSEPRYVREARERLAYLSKLLKYQFSGTLEAVKQRIDFTGKAPDNIQALRHPGQRLDVSEALRILRNTDQDSALTLRAKCLLAAASSELSLREIGEKMGGIAQPTVSRLLNLSDLKQNPRIETLFSFAQALDLTLEKILQIKA